MFDKNTNKDWVSATIMATVGAGAAAMFAIGQGQHPLMAFGITVFAVLTALLIDHYL